MANLPLGLFRTAKQISPQPGFIMYDSSNHNQYIVEYDSLTGWSAVYTPRTHGVMFWNRRSDGSYVSFGGTLSNDLDSTGMVLEKYNIYINNIKHTASVAAQEKWIYTLAAGLDSNDDLIVLIAQSGTSNAAIWKYDYSTWVHVVDFDLPPHSHADGVASSSYSEIMMNEAGTYFVSQGLNLETDCKAIKIYFDGTFDTVAQASTYIVYWGGFEEIKEFQGWSKSGGEWIGGNTTLTRLNIATCINNSIVEVENESTFEVQQGFPRQTDYEWRKSPSPYHTPNTTHHYTRYGSMLHNELWVEDLEILNNDSGTLSHINKITTAAGEVVAEETQTFNSYWWGGSSNGCPSGSFNPGLVVGEKISYMEPRIPFVNQRKQWRSDGVWLATSYGDGDAGAYNTTWASLYSILQGAGVTGAVSSLYVIGFVGGREY